MTDIDKLLDDLQHGRHVSLVDLPAILNELRDLRRLRDLVESSRTMWCQSTEMDEPLANAFGVFEFTGAPHELYPSAAPESVSEWVCEYRLVPIDLI